MWNQPPRKSCALLVGVPVAGEQRRAAHRELARLRRRATSRSSASTRRTSQNGLCGFESARRRDADRDQARRARRAAGLGRAERVRVRRAEQRGDLRDLRGRHEVRHHAAHLHAARRDAAARELGGEPPDHAGHQQQPAERSRRDDLGEPRRVEAVDDDHRAAGHQRAERVLDRAHVIERRPRDERVVGRDAELGARDEVAHDLARDG